MKVNNQKQHAPPKDIITEIEDLDKERNEALATLNEILGC